MTLREALADLKELRPAREPAAFERFSSGRPYERDLEATVVDGGAFRLFEVPALGRTGFTHFLDGAQKLCGGLHWRFSPLPLVHVSAAVVERKGVEMSQLEEENYTSQLMLLHPDHPDLCRVLDERVRVQGGFDDIRLTPVKPHSFGDYEEAVVKAISQARNEMEALVARGLKSGRLLVDGGLGNVPGNSSCEVVAGVVKSHGIRYLGSFDREDLVLNMRVGQRSSLFERPSDKLQGEAVYSFYLKVNDHGGSDPWHGIVRIELPMKDESVERTDEIAGWILHECTPLSLPDPRYDKLLYPIRLVEQHLKARQPSSVAVMGRIG